MLLMLVVSKALCQETPPLVYTHGNQKIEITTEKGKCVLKNGKRNQITINTQNIDTRMMTCSGPGLRLVRTTNPEQTESIWEINLENWEANKPYTLFFNYRGNKTRFGDKFEIPTTD